MAIRSYKAIRMLGMAAVMSAIALFTGCAASAHSTTVVHNPSPQSQPEDRQADEFIGTPIMGDYDNEEDLDFVLEVNDGGKVFKVEVHESAGGGNRALLEKVRRRVNAMEDAGSIRVIGYYSSEYRGSSKEYGFMDLKMVAFYDEETGKEEAFFTDPQDSPFYTQSDVTVVYAPGHHYNTIHYPMYVSPWWDRDGDGIPNRYDPWPHTYDTWYDYNMNYIPDWYDPYYAGYYSYWDYWHMDFWVGYNWYSPRYYHHGGYYHRGGYYNTGAYYNDYRTYTRLYDKRHVNNRDNSNRRMLRLDAKSEHIWRNAYERDRNRTTRVANSAPGTRSYRGYESRPVDNRVLVNNSDRSRTTTNSRDRVVATTGGRNYNGGSDTFTRNRVTSGTPADNSRTRGRDVARVAGTDKTKTSRAVSTNTRTRSDRASVSSRTAGSSGRVRGSEGRSSSSSSRSRNVSSGRTTTSSSSRTYKPTSRSRSSSGSSAVRGSSSGGSKSSGSSRVRSSSGSRPSTASSGGSATRSRSSSGSRSQPAARSSSSRNRSSSSGSARSSSSSRSRSSSSSSKSSGSSSNRRKR